MQTTSSTDGEVAPYIGAGAEIEFLQTTAGGLEPSIWVLSSDATGDDVTFWSRLTLELGGLWLLEIKVDLVGAMGVQAIKLADITDAMERNTHRYLKLSCREVDTADHFGGWVLDLETRVELEEIEFILRWAVEI